MQIKNVFVSLFFLSLFMTVSGQIDMDSGIIMTIDKSVASIQVEGYSVPSFADWNNDGLLDLLVGEGPTTALPPDWKSYAKVRVYLNNGSWYRHAYKEYIYVQSDGSDLEIPASYGCMGCFPRAEYWDADGLKDLVVGTQDGKVMVFLNTNTDQQPEFDEGKYLDYGPGGSKVQINVAGRATPCVTDWNNDGSKDLVVGSYSGVIYLYINEGTDIEPDFLSQQRVQLGGSNLIVPSIRSSPAVFDMDRDDRKDLVCGNTNGQLFFYPNMGTDAQPVFTEYSNISSNGVNIDLAGDARSRPFVMDFDYDGWADIAIGAGDGKVHFFPGRPKFPTEQFDVISAASKRLMDRQNNDGGWDRIDDGDPDSGTEANIVNLITYNLAFSYYYTSDTDLLSSVDKASIHLLSITDTFFSREAAAAYEMDMLLGTDIYLDHVKENFYDRLENGTYYDALSGIADLDTSEYIDLIIDSYMGDGKVNVAAWDLSMALYNVQTASAGTEPWLSSLLGLVEIMEAGQSSDVLGLASAVFALGVTGSDYDPVSGAHADADDIYELADKLAGYQLSTGGFTYDSQEMDDGVGNETIFETAMAVLALRSVDKYYYFTQISRALDYLEAVQLSSGGWENYTGSGEDNFYTSMCLLAFTAGTGPKGDIQADGRLDLSDFAQFSAEWHSTYCQECGSADLNYDGHVKFDDLVIFIDYWMSTGL